MSRAAYEGAIAQGADGLECDIRLTKDRQIICWHDADTKRITGVRKRISSSTLADLAFAQPLTFIELLDLAIAHKKDLAIETKHPVKFRGAIERELLKTLFDRRDAIAESGIEIVVMSFSWFALNRVKSSPFETVFLINSRFKKIFDRFAITGPSVELVKRHPSIVTKAKNRLQPIYIWTVNEPADLTFCADLGVDVLITDIPFHAREVLG
jgi:glycerophosphoryl diester phosphodiesterase